MEALSRAMVESAAGAVELAIALVGVMALFLGLMKVAEAGGLLKVIARLIRPFMVRLFPDVPAGHPAMSAMILNLSANVMGLGNAATPFGIRAMQELNKLNRTPGTATDAMALFLAINTSSVTLLPTGVIALRAAAGSADPAGIFPTTLFATACSTLTAVVASKLLGRCCRRRPPTTAPDDPEADPATTADAAELAHADTSAYPVWVSTLALALALALIPLTVAYGENLSPWIMPGLMTGFLIFGVSRRVRVYEVFVEGAKEGFQVAIRILHDPAIGPDSYTGCLVSTLQGSTETTFYVLAVYFGAVQVRRIRYALAAGLTADLAGVIGSVAACSYLFR
jgi:spore maturation protein SpmA